MKSYHYVVALIVLIGVMVAVPSAAETGSAPAVITLEEAISKAITASPNLKGADADIAAAIGGRSQAGALANPEVSVEAENIGGTGAYSGFRSAELTAGVSQVIEIGGKRSARIDMADRAQQAAVIQRDIARANLVLEVSKAYVAAAAAQEMVALYQSQVDLAEDVLSAVGQRVSAAAEPVIQQSKAKVAFASSKIALEKARRAESSATKTLVILMGSTAPLKVDTTAFYQVIDPAALDTRAALMNSLDFKYASASLDKAMANIDYEHAAGIPDPSLNAGVRQFRDDDEQAFLVGLSIPLPVFNANGGNIEKARQEANKADASRLAALNENMTKLESHIMGLQAAYIEVSQIKADVLPQAEAAFGQARRGYNAGKFPYLEVLDAQRTLAETKLAHVVALKDYHNNKAEIDRLTANGTQSKEIAQ